jgi:hypothetical protein
MRVAPHLLDLRGEAWRKLVERVIAQSDASLDQLAFSLLLVRLGGCLTCHTDSYRAMRGCTICATQAIKRFKGDDEGLIALFESARADILELMRVDGESQTRSVHLSEEEVIRE